MGRRNHSGERRTGRRTEIAVLAPAAVPLGMAAVFFAVGLTRLKKLE